ncbi:choline-glycine betaine transporter [Microbacterium sp. W4I20]|nr:choline-glycine betaine transporter [Microbacterium sp. W4I20]
MIRPRGNRRVMSHVTDGVRWYKRWTYNSWAWWTE